MSLSRRQGVTLVEVLVALILLGILGTVMSRLVIRQRQGASALVALEGAYRTVDQASGWIASELVEAGNADGVGDLLSLAPDSLSYRAWRSVGLACLVSETEVRLRRDRLESWRSPQPARDSLMLFLSSDSLPEAGSWVVAPILGVAPSTCSGTAALAIQTRLTPTGLALPMLVPTRTFEVMQLRLYRSLGEWWLGARSLSAGEGIQPLAGPFDDRGLRLSFFDTLGNIAAESQAVERLQLGLTPVGYRDTARLTIWLRNLR